MKSLSKTSVLFIVSLVATVAAIGAYASFFIAMKDKTQATADLSVKIRELSGKESRMGAAVAALKAEEANIEKLATYFIKESEIVLFTKKIEQLGPQSGTTLSLESLDPGIGEDKSPILNFRVKAGGKFPDIMRLLMLLENYPAKLEWKTVSLTRDDSSVPVDQKTGKPVNTIPRWRVEILLTAFNFVNE